ncbi:MAG TPA: sulfotransferase [Sphingomicrobium sp.]|nr:sulfotransferase [Sphingomicrobium sp.]
MDRAFNPQTAPNVAAALAHGRRLLGSDPRLAAEQAREILASVPANADAFRLLGEALRRSGEDEAANDAELAAIAASVHDPELIGAGRALVENDLPTAESILRPVLKRRPTDVAAIRMMAELAARLGRRVDAENLLRRAIELAPGWAAARANLATILHRQHRAAEALAELDQIERLGAEGDAQRNLRAAALGRLGGYDEAIGLYRDVLSRHPAQPKVWMSLGHILKTVGEQAEAIAAYRRAIEITPSLGEAWWSLANLKTVRFSDDDVAAMRDALADEALGEDDRLHLQFALGKALEDRHEDEAAFASYSQGNRIRAAQLHYDPTVITAHVEACETLFTRDFLAERAGAGCPAPDPIFILGMPRAGSTLLEQILASHPLVEGTMELPDIIALSQRAGRGDDERGRNTRYPAVLAELTPEELRALGQEYLDRTRIQRTGGKPFFIDKMPNNWTHAGFIRLILPNARIIDARRHPLACCFSNFKQHYARGQAFSYSLETVGSYYRDYVRLMAHFEGVMPGAVRRVIHEELVADPEAEIRRLLDDLKLPFDEACLNFHESKRPVRTASSEQVRRPISSEGLEQWRRFEAWLGPLRQALGPALDHWDDAPKP